MQNKDSPAEGIKDFKFFAPFFSEQDEFAEGMDAFLSGDAAKAFKPLHS